VSEYQYYEFVSVDRPLSSAQQDELRAISTRAQITASSFVNTYQWGDLKANPMKLMERYFDAFLYLANWGTHRVCLRLPVGLLDPDTAAAYCVGESACCQVSGRHVILDLHSDDEDGDWEQDGHGLLASIVPVRGELAAGDTRLLYLAWLLCVQGRELDDDVVEPPVPPGLGQLSGPLQSFATFLRLDQDLLAAAAEASGPLASKTPTTTPLTRWVRNLPEADKDDVIVRLLHGKDPHLRGELLRRLHGPTPAAAAGGRKAGELLAAAEERWAARQRAAQQRQAAERARREQAAAATREQRLQVLAADPEQAWRRVDALIATTKPKEYDAAVALLVDLKALAERDGQTAAYRQRITLLRQQHARKPSLLDRLDRARLR
jgi:hypothetical protein